MPPDNPQITQIRRRFDEYKNSDAPINILDRSANYMTDIPILFAKIKDLEKRLAFMNEQNMKLMDRLPEDAA